MTSLTTKPSQTEATTPRGKPPLSRWWPISLLCVWPVLITASALLMAIGFGYYDGTSSGMIYAQILIGGFACLGLGLAVKSAFWVLMIVRYRQVRRLPALPVERPLSRWWAIGLFWPAFAFVVAGATLFGLGTSLFDTFNTRAPKEPYYSQFCSGLACLAIGLALMTASWAAVVVRHREWKRAQHAVPPAGMHVNGGVLTVMSVPGHQMAHIRPPVSELHTTQQQLSPNTAELSGQRQSPSTVELSAQQQQQQQQQQQPTRSMTAFSERRQRAHTTAELSGQHLLKLASISNTPAVQPLPTTANFPAEYVPHQYATIVQTSPGPPTPRAGELPALASPAELPSQPSLHPPTVSLPFHPFPQHLFSTQKEVASLAGKRPAARFCTYCGATLDPSTKLCGQCGS